MTCCGPRGCVRSFFKNLEVNVFKVIFVLCADCKLAVSRVEKVVGAQGFRGSTFKKTLKFDGTDR